MEKIKNDVLRYNQQCKYKRIHNKYGNKKSLKNIKKTIDKKA